MCSRQYPTLLLGSLYLVLCWGLQNPIKKWRQVPAGPLRPPASCVCCGQCPAPRSLGTASWPGVPGLPYVRARPHGRDPALSVPGGASSRRQSGGAGGPRPAGACGGTHVGAPCLEREWVVLQFSASFISTRSGVKPGEGLSALQWHI